MKKYLVLISILIWILFGLVFFSSCSYEKRLQKWSQRVPSTTDTLFRKATIFSTDTLTINQLVYYHDTFRVECPNDMEPIVYSGGRTIIKKINKNSFQVVPVGDSKTKTFIKTKVDSSSSLKGSTDVIAIPKNKKHPGLHLFLYLLGVATIPAIKLVWKLIKTYIKVQVPLP